MKNDQSLTMNSKLSSPLSQIPSGYKQTEVGVIPEDWKFVSASQICEMVVDCKNRTPPVIEGGNFAVVRTPNVRNGRFVREELRFTDKKSFQEWTARAIPQVGDILITREAPLGEVCAVPEDLKVCLGQRMMLYRPDSNRANSSFLLYSLMAPAVQSCLLKKIGGSTVGHAKVDDIRNLEIALPPTIAEQEAIAQALSDTDALIESLEQLLAKKRQIKQGLMAELLRPKDGWVQKHLGELANISRGASPRPIDNPVWFDENSEIGWVRISDVTKSGNFLYETTQKLSPLGVKNSRFVSRNSLIMSICATVGRPIITRMDVCIHDGFVVFDALQSDLKFMFYILKSLEDGWSKHGQTGSQMNLNTNLINGTKVEIPASKSEQIEIATILSDMDLEISAIEEKLTKTRQLKQGMMHQLLTGKIRLVDPG